MVQFNLLPDVKIEFLKTRQRKRLIIAISAVSTAAFLAIFIILFLYVRVNQTRHMSDLTKDINKTADEIKSTQDLDKIITIQSQLSSLTALHDKKVVSSRLVSYLNQLTPNAATISEVSLDFSANTMVLKGNTDSIITVNKFVDTIKFTNYKVDGTNGAEGKAFKDVVLTSFSIPSQGSNEASYEISFAYDPAIFAQHKNSENNTFNNVTLNVPQIISTRSSTEKPSNLFERQPEKPAQPQQTTPQGAR